MRVKAKMNDPIKFWKTRIKLYLTFLISFRRMGVEDESGGRLKIYHHLDLLDQLSCLAKSSYSHVLFSFLLRTVGFQF